MTVRTKASDEKLVDDGFARLVNQRVPRPSEFMAQPMGNVGPGVDEEGGVEEREQLVLAAAPDQPDVALDARLAVEEVEPPVLAVGVQAVDRGETVGWVDAPELIGTTYQLVPQPHEKSPSACSAEGLCWCSDLRNCAGGRYWV